MEMSQTITQDTCVALERSDEELIKRLCPSCDDEGLIWYDITSAKVGLSVKYLRMRGKIVIHPSGTMVRFI